MPAVILKDLSIVEVEDMDEVLEAALEVADPERIFCGRDNRCPISGTLLKEQYLNHTH